MQLWWNVLINKINDRTNKSSSLCLIQNGGQIKYFVYLEITEKATTAYKN